MTTGSDPACSLTGKNWAGSTFTPWHQATAENIGDSDEEGGWYKIDVFESAMIESKWDELLSDSLEIETTINDSGWNQ